MFKCPKCSQEFDNPISINHHWVRGHKLNSKDLYINIFLNGAIPLCECGCGQEPNYKSISKGFKKFVHGHNSKPLIQFDKNVEKHCPACKKILPLSNFGIRNDSQKYQSYCRECSLGYRRERRLSILENSENIPKRNCVDVSDISVKKYGGPDPIKIGNTPIDKEYILSLDDVEKERLSIKIFSYYRKNGFPYPTYDQDTLFNSFIKMKNRNADIFIDGVIRTSINLGNDIFYQFSPHFFECKSVSETSMLDAFNDDTILLSVIKNRMGITYKETFNITGAMIRQGMRSTRSCANISIFKSIIAKFLYERYCPDGGNILDFSSGFGQRLLGALSCNKQIKYIGCDPYKKMFNANLNIFNFLNDAGLLDGKEVELHNCGAENLNLESESIDFAFSSPPYYNQEIYSNDVSQAYQNKSYDDFLVWWDSVVIKIYTFIKKGGLFSFNISTTYSEDMDKVVLNYFSKVETLYIENNTTHFNKNNKTKKEPIFIYKK